jgi:hypothetical protein
MDADNLWNWGTSLINFAASVKTLMPFDLPAKERIGIVKLTPVIFSGDAGRAGEYHASNNPNQPESHILDTAIPKGTKIIGAWYTPLHNIPALNAFALIDVERHNDTQVKLNIAGFPKISARLRIAVYVLYTK